MRRGTYRSYRRPTRSKRRIVLWSIVVLLFVVAGVLAFKYFTPTSVEKAVDQLQFDASVTDSEKQAIKDAMQAQSKTYSGTVQAGVTTTTEAADTASVLAAYLPVTDVYATRQAVTKAELGTLTLYVPQTVPAQIKEALATFIGVDATTIKTLASLDDIPDTAVAFVAPSDLSTNVKLLTFEGSYYLDSFQKGAIFRQVSFTGGGATGLSGLVLNS